MGRIPVEKVLMIERNAVDYFAKHRGMPAFVIGNGPSASNLIGYDAYVKDNFVTIGMNRSWQLIDSQYHVIMFHHEHLEDLKRNKFSTKGVTLWTYKDYSEMWVREVEEGDVIYVPSVADPRNEMHQFNLAGMISLDLSECSYADMTGMFALEVALWLRCDPIFLIGYDLYGGHFCDSWKPEDEWQSVQVDLFDLTAEQIEVEAPWASIYNCNQKSRILGFKKLDLEVALQWKTGK